MIGFSGQLPMDRINRRPPLLSACSLDLPDDRVRNLYEVERDRSWDQTTSSDARWERQGVDADELPSSGQLGRIVDKTRAPCDRRGCEQIIAQQGERARNGICVVAPVIEVSQSISNVPVKTWKKLNDSFSSRCRRQFRVRLNVSATSTTATWAKSVRPKMASVKLKRQDKSTKRRLWWRKLSRGDTSRRWIETTSATNDRKAFEMTTAASSSVIMSTNDDESQSVVHVEQDEAAVGSNDSENWANSGVCDDGISEDVVAGDAAVPELHISDDHEEEYLSTFYHRRWRLSLGRRSARKEADWHLEQLQEGRDDRVIFPWKWTTANIPAAARSSWWRRARQRENCWIAATGQEETARNSLSCWDPGGRRGAACASPNEEENRRRRGRAGPLTSSDRIQWSIQSEGEFIVYRTTSSVVNWMTVPFHVYVYIVDRAELDKGDIVVVYRPRILRLATKRRSMLFLESRALCRLS